jgi:hypothetical protein
MSETRRFGQFAVTKTRLLGTNEYVYTAYEPYNGHHTLTHIDGVRMGRVASREIPREMDRLPAYSEARSVAVRSFYAVNKHVAYAAIIQAFPDVWDGHPDDGDIRATESASAAEAR